MRWSCNVRLPWCVRIASISVKCVCVYLPPLLLPPSLPPSLPLLRFLVILVDYLVHCDRSLLPVCGEFGALLYPRVCPHGQHSTCHTGLIHAWCAVVFLWMVYADPVVVLPCHSFLRRCPRRSLRADMASLTGLFLITRRSSGFSWCGSSRGI